MLHLLYFCPMSLPVIALQLTQLCSLFLLAYSLPFSWQVLRFWNVDLATERQLSLERQNGVVGATLDLVLFFQFVILILFLQTANMHLPNLIRGAMCATGTLGANAYGYPALYAKIGLSFLYATYLFLNRLENTSPSYSLTPAKYYWIFFIFVGLLIDFGLTHLYFININPELISNCCSVSFLVENSTAESFVGTNENVLIYLIVAFSSFLLGFGTLFFFKNRFLLLFSSLIYAVSGILSLKYFFVKYIYGLPSHLCLFDLFLPQEYFIGYPIIGSGFVAVLGVWFVFLYRTYQHLLAQNALFLAQKAEKISFFFWFLSAFIPSLYWFFWEGNL